MAVPQQFALRVGKDAAISAATALLIHYFDLAPASAKLLVKKWLVNYPAIWVRSAVTEALYQGRYKPISVEQILTFWQRRGRIISHFNYEFETLIAVPLQGELNVWEEEDEQMVTAPYPTHDSSPATIQAITPSPRSAIPSPIPPIVPTSRPRLMLPGEATVTGKASAQSQEEAPPSNTPATSPALGNGFEPVLASQANHQSAPEQKPPKANTHSSIGSQPLPAAPIGPFTPADDPSGFASRLKTVVEQAISKAKAAQSETEVASEMIDLQTAITDSIAQDPVLGVPANPSSTSPQPPSESVTTTPVTITPKESAHGEEDNSQRQNAEVPIVERPTPAAPSPPSITQVSDLLASLGESPPSLEEAHKEELLADRLAQKLFVFDNSPNLEEPSSEDE